MLIKVANDVKMIATMNKMNPIVKIYNSTITCKVHPAGAVIVNPESAFAVESTVIVID